mmetsp:Transcript_34322/g.76201  ORF Transcript_34322/g.76201 Transcript_34322/m.76201 type:complete len:208 (+) Transcript_34322:447-1070(+)
MKAPAWPSQRSPRVRSSTTMTSSSSQQWRRQPPRTPTLKLHRRTGHKAMAARGTMPLGMVLMEAAMAHTSTAATTTRRTMMTAVASPRRRVGVVWMTSERLWRLWLQHPGPRSRHSPRPLKLSPLSACLRRPHSKIMHLGMMPLEGVHLVLRLHPAVSLRLKRSQVFLKPQWRPRPLLRLQRTWGQQTRRASPLQPYTTSQLRGSRS